MSHELAVRALAEAPCDHCARAVRCATEHLACSAFVAVAEGRRHWNVLPRADANRERYERVLENSV
ncbi:MAG: hypothetical protein WAU56_07415 [Steroidobacteraceae bacterium]